MYGGESKVVSFVVYGGGISLDKILCVCVCVLYILSKDYVYIIQV